MALAEETPSQAGRRDRASFIRGLSHTAALPIDAIFRHRAPHADKAAHTNTSTPHSDTPGNEGVKLMCAQR